MGSKTYRVLLDFGDVEMTVWTKTDETDNQGRIQDAINDLKIRGFVYQEEPTVIDIEHCPEWYEDETENLIKGKDSDTVTEWCSHCDSEVELPRGSKPIDVRTVLTSYCHMPNV